MLDRILSALGKCGIEDYHIVVKDEQSAELFFIKKELDMQRLKKVQTADVSVYHVFEEGDNRFRGVASVQVQDSLTQPEMEKLFADAYYAAGFVKNKYYDLYEGTKVGMVQAKDPFGEKTLNEMVQGFAQALFAEDVYKEVFINSAEIFASRLTVHIRNSRGVDGAVCRVSLLCSAQAGRMWKPIRIFLITDGIWMRFVRRRAIQ